MLNKNKIALIVTLMGTIMLSGCMNGDLEGHSVHMTQTTNKPLKIDTYNNDGQKIEEFKTDHVKIHDDKKLTQAIDLTYGQNKIIHTSSSLIVNDGLTNYLDKYRTLQAKNGETVSETDKSIPMISKLYLNFKKDFPNIEHENMVLVKSQAGTPIAAFMGQEVSVKEIGTSDFPNSVITIDGAKVFVYDCSYTIYPSSDLKAMGQDKTMPKTKKQTTVKTSQAAPIDTGKKSK